MANNMVQEYKPNSHSYKAKQKALENKQTEKKIEKVVTGKVITKKKSGFSSFASDFVSVNLKDIKRIVIDDTLIPKIKEVLYDIVMDTTDVILYGDTKRSRSRRGIGSNTVLYNKFSDRSRRDPRPVLTPQHQIEDVILERKSDADSVLDRMQEILDQYGIVKVSDLNELTGRVGFYTDHSFGWTSLAKAEIVRVREGWLIQLPRPMSIS